jgi:hypothetical protein
MFCPNCGNNCGDARFCSSCGTQLQQAAAPTAQSGEWKVGMPCPHCGGTKLNGDCCAFCGAQLMAKEEPKPMEATVWEDSYDFPYRGFYGHSRAILLERDGITLEKALLFKKERTKIAYSNLIETSFSYNGLTNAKMVFTTDTGKREVVEIRAEGLRSDDIIIYFMIFYLIKFQSEENTLFEIEMPDATLNVVDSCGCTVELRSYFERFGPSRKDAATAFCSEHEMLFDEAYALMDKAFYLFQCDLYDNDPIKAVRDYNRIMAERHEEYLEDKEMRANRGLKRRKR